MNDSGLGITKENLLLIVPPALTRDPAMMARAAADAEAMAARLAEIDRVRIISNIDGLDETVLDILARDFKVDWWDPEYSIEEKRRTLKGSWRVHKILGTKAAVETAIRAIYPLTTVEEWFEYGGDPFRFKVIIGAAEGVTAEQQAAVLERVRFYKNLRSHLETISYQMEQATTIHVAGYHAIGTRLEVWPYLADNFTEEATVFVGAVATFATRLEINPSLTNFITSSGSMLFGGYTQQTRKLQIQPLRNEG